MIVVWVLVAVGVLGLLLLGVTVARHLRRLTREREAVRRDVTARTAELARLSSARRAPVNPSGGRDEHPASP